MMMRSLTSFEQGFLKGDIFCQLSLRLKNPSIVRDFVSKFGQRAACLRLKADENYLYREDKPFTIHNIPKNITSLNDASRWMFENAPVVSSERLGNIGIVDDLLVFQANHGFADGRYIAKLLESVQRDNDFNEKFGDPFDINNFFKKDLEVFDNSILPPLSDARSIPIKSGNLENENPKFNFYEGILDVPSLPNYNKGLDRLEKHTEFLWLSSSLAACTLINDYSHLGISTCIDLRRVIPHEIRSKEDWNILNFFCNQTVYTPIKLSEKLGDIAKRLRDNFNDEYKKKHYLSFLSYYNDDSDAPKLHSFIANSNIGYYYAGENVKDLLFRYVANPYTYNVVSNNNYSFKTKDKHKLIMFVNHSTMKLSDEALRKYVDATCEIYKNLSFDMTAEDAVKLAKRFI